MLLAVVLALALGVFGAFETSRWFAEKRRHLQAEAKRVAEQAKSEAEAAAARERERHDEEAAETKRFEEGARLAFEAVQRAEAEAAEAARRKKQEDEEAAKKIKEEEEARTKALAETKTKRTAEEEKKEQRRALCARAGHFHVKGMRELETGNVTGAREFFRLGADEGLWQSAKALAGTYDPEQLAKFHVLGLQLDIFAAKEWMRKRGYSTSGPSARKVSSQGCCPSRRISPTPMPIWRCSGPPTPPGTGSPTWSSKVQRTSVSIAMGMNRDQHRRKIDAGAYTLYTCNERHVFVLQDQENRTALRKAMVVKFGEPGFPELDARYVSGCNNPDIRSAVPRN